MSTVRPLPERIAERVIEAVQNGEFAEGDHLSAQNLANRFGVSRFPVRAALELLNDRGVLDRRANRGYFVRPLNGPGLHLAAASEPQPFDTAGTYHRFAEDWLSNAIPAELTELMLRERYELTRSGVNDILMRAMREGWAERKEGYGWRLLPVAKTPEGFQQLYRFRLVIEPMAMLEPTYRIDTAVIERLRRTQSRMLDSEIENLPAETLLANGALFHEELIKFSGNFFFYQSLERVNRMRRLLEYKSRVDRTRIYSQCVEHLELLDLLQRGEVHEASYAMRRHLGGALTMKASILGSEAR